MEEEVVTAYFGKLFQSANNQNIHEVYKYYCDKECSMSTWTDIMQNESDRIYYLLEELFKHPN